MIKYSILLTFVLLFMPISASFAQNVSKQPTKCNVLLEDFTGFKCGNCPDAHKYIDKLQIAQPEKVFPVAVHAGYYATTNAADQPNFVINEGTEINDFYGISSYPSGLVNRREMGMAGIVQSRSYWISSCRANTLIDADVNVWVSSTYNKETKILSTDVELYYINNVENSGSALCVSLLQSGILGPQAGGNMEDEYVHNHVLRAMFTPTWGDTIDTSSEGTIVKKHYEYNVPDVIGNIETDPLHFDVVAYVINSEKEVMNVNGCKVQCPGMTLPLKASLEEYKMKSMRNYGFNFFECYLKNEGTEPLTSATFKFTLDEDDEIECAWTASEGCAIPGLERGYVRFPIQIPSSYVAGGCDSYKLQLTSVNGKPCSNDAVKGSFGAMINVEGNVRGLIKTDNYADDNSFHLLDADGNLIAEYGPFIEGKAESNEVTLSFPTTGIYCFEITDSWGNGILSPRGNIKLYNNAGDLILQNNEITDFGYRVFFNCTVVDGIEYIENTSKSKEKYNLSGQRVLSLHQGQLYIQNGKRYIQK